MTTTSPEPRPLEAIAPRAVIHQEGVLLLLALAGLVWRQGDPIAPLLAGTDLLGVALAAALAAMAGGLGIVATRAGWFGGLVGLERRLVAGWSTADAVTVAIASGIAEEALIRGFLQQWWGWLPANLIFGLLHIYPRREAAAWPIAAFALGCAFASAAMHWGVPAAMAAHAVFNAISLEELRRDGGEGSISG